DVKLIVDSLDTIVFPLVNPDGRAYVQDPAGDVWWRKNRAAHPGTACIGVDLNRNFDLLWSSGIGTSADPCEYQIYRGPSAFSEPETRNVRALLDSFPNVDCMIDVHSYSEDFLYPWGDDENQSTITAVRGRPYTPKESIGLYPTSGTSDDYAYARHFVDGAKRRVYAFTLETGREFQPVYSEALQIIDEVSAGLLEFLLAAICVVDEVARGTHLADRLDELHAVGATLAKSKAGRAWVDQLERSSPALVRLLSADEGLRKEAEGILAAAVDVVGPRAPREGVVPKEL